MSLVSNSRKFLVLFMIGMVAFGTVFLITPTSAQASTVHPSATTILNTSRIEAFPLGILASTPSPATTTQLQAVGLKTWPSWDDVTSFLNDAGCTIGAPVGAALSATTGICDDTPIGTVVEGVSDALDCATNLTECITRWIYDVIGAGVSWVVKGIVDLIVGSQAACDPTGNGGSGSGDWDTVNSGCEDRIAQDYFPSGYIQETKLSDVVAKSYTDQRRDIRAQMRTLRTQGLRNTPEYEGLAVQLALLNGNTSSDPLASTPTIGAIRANNSLFYVSKSAVSTPAWDREYGKYVLIGLMLLVPMIIASALQALISGKAGTMARAVLFHMPIAIIGMIVTPWLVRTLMAITDSFSSFIISDVHGDVDGFFSNPDPTAMLKMGIPLLLGFSLVAMVFIFAGLLIWFILSMREASVALISVFLPIAFAASVWPALGKWSLRAIKLLLAAIISKVFIVGALSLGIGTFGGSTSSGGFSISHMIFGATIFFIAAFSPHLVMKFFDEIGDAINAAGGTGALARGLSVAGNVNGTRALLGGGGGGGGGGVGGGGVGSSASMAQLGAEMSAANGGTPGANAATAARINRAGGGSNAENIHAGAQGAGAGAGAADPNNMVQGAYDTAMGQANGGAGIAPGAATEAQAAQIGSEVSQAALANGATQAQANELGEGAAAYAMNGPGAPGAPSAAAPGNVNNQVHASTTAHARQLTQQARKNRRASTSFMTKLGRLAMNVSPVGNVAYGIGAAARRRQDAAPYR